MSLLIGDNAVVSLHYKLSDAQGNEIENSAGAEPLKYLHGAGNLIIGLENALVGKASGAQVSVAVPAEEAYGEIQAELIQQVERSMFQGIDTIEPGMAFQSEAPDGSVQRIVVRDVEGDTVTIDANHPLAGETLHFDVEVLEVRNATEEEIAHGHAH
ncbi:FKBP-type peptidyl-prolyl cis-trans isomerase [Sediminihaliea albiluteola]